MPIYKPEEYPSVIERIKAKIAQKNIDLGVYRFGGRHYCFGACLQHPPAAGVPAVSAGGW